MTGDRQSRSVADSGVVAIDSAAHTAGQCARRRAGLGRLDGTAGAGVGRGGLFAWSLGLGYLMYDVGLQVFTGWQIAKIAAPIAAVPNAPDAAPACDSSQRVSVAVLIVAPTRPGPTGDHRGLLDQTDPPDEIVRLMTVRPTAPRHGSTVSSDRPSKLRLWSMAYV